MLKTNPEVAAAEAALAVRVKRALRQRMAQVRRALPASVRTERSQRIVELVTGHPSFVAASGVALFAPMLEQGEVDVTELDMRCRAAGKRVYYPFMQPTQGGFHTGFRRVSQGHE